MKTSGHVAKITKFAKTYGLWKFVSFLCNVVQLNIPTPSVVCAAYILKSYVKKKMHQMADRAKSYDISKFPNFYAHFLLV